MLVSTKPSFVPFTGAPTSKMELRPGPGEAHAGSVWVGGPNEPPVEVRSQAVGCG